MQIDSYQKLNDTVTALTLGQRGVVLLDGASGSGKSHVAMHLARDLNAFRISLDNYVDTGRDGAYIDQLMLEFLKDDISRLQPHFRLIIFEGICARDILAKIGTDAIVTIYVKKVGTSGNWHFEFHLEDFLNGSVAAKEPFRSDYEYHARTLPHNNSDIMYVRVAD